MFLGLSTYLNPLRFTFFSTDGVSGVKNLNTVELRLSRLIGMASHPDMQKIWIIEFFFENRQHWQFEVWLLLFTVSTCI
jgi:hypothetical protein